MADAKVNYIRAPTDAPPSYDHVIPAAPPRHAQRLPLPLALPLIDSLRTKRVILASASPRRKQLLNQIGLTNLEIIPSTVPEAFPKSLSPFEYVLQTALQKVQTIYSHEINNAQLGDPALVIAADTVVVASKGQILEKPRSEAEHIAMLKMLRDTGVHKVFTAVAAMAPLETARDPGYALEHTVEETTVRFNKNMSDEYLLAYVKTREGADKAGGYGIQGIGAILVDGIDGSFDNVVGLPLKATLDLITKVLDQDDELEDEFEKKLDRENNLG
ncbi:hypothetical protein MMC25_004710 [Agyrium rufum]|nr:hypothetical protein [Agyrium rufum]